jgi:hypothetical protein
MSRSKVNHSKQPTGHVESACADDGYVKQ